MPGVPFSAGCCGGVKPSRVKNVDNDPQLEEPKQEVNEVKSLPKNKGMPPRGGSGRKKVKYGAKEPCCCHTR